MACDFVSATFFRNQQSLSPSLIDTIMVGRDIPCRVPGCPKRFKSNKGSTYHYRSMHENNNEIRPPSSSESSSSSSPSLDQVNHGFDFDQDWSQHNMDNSTPPPPLSPQSPLQKNPRRIYHPYLTGSPNLLAYAQIYSDFQLQLYHAILRGIPSLRALSHYPRLARRVTGLHLPTVFNFRLLIISTEKLRCPGTTSMS